MKIGINGFGRIGRAFLRRALPMGLEIVAINDITDAPTLAHLLAHDSTYGTFGLPVASSASSIEVDGRAIPVTAHRDPAGIDWTAYGADLVIEATGKFRSRDEAAVHLKAGAGCSSPLRARASTPPSCPASTTPPTTRSATRSSRWPPAPPTASRRWSRCCTRTSAWSRGS
nr:hypothetical protein GCM10020093_019350 [Planobispora longispora]